MSSRIPALLLGLALAPAPGRADWAMLRGNAQHTGHTDQAVERAYHLSWAREFNDERLGTAMEAIVDSVGVYVATHQGSLYGLDPTTGAIRWRFSASGPFLHSPALRSNLLIAASADGHVYGLDTATGALRWQVRPSRAGFSASPVVDDACLYLGDRGGTFFAILLEDGHPVWTRRLTAPIRQTAALDEGRIIVTSEDLLVHGLNARSGELLWTSPALAGQSARDTCPMVIRVGGRAYAVIRTNPAINMAQRIARDRSLLARHAGADDSDWRKLDVWLKSPAAHGSPEWWTSEQAAICEHLESEPSARTFFLLAAATGEPAGVPPILWVGGCQGVGVMPARTSNDQLLVLHRTAYGNWNHGVAPLVGLGLLDLPSGRLTPLFHTAGAQPPWNTFWGTADEAQSLVVAGGSALIVHQGTLSRFDLETHELLHLAGNRDTFGGLPSTRWARNEWHGPARGGVAVANSRLYWLTGSRLLCLQPGPAKAGDAVVAQAESLPFTNRVVAEAPDWNRTREELAEGVREVLSQTWAPLVIEPGLAGRQFHFDHSGELFESLAWAYPHLPEALQQAVRDHLHRAWESHRPFTAGSSYPVSDGAAREWAPVPEEVRRRAANPPQFHPFGNLAVAWFYAQRCDERRRLVAAWPEIKRCHADFLQRGWKLDPEQGDLWANRYAASWIALASLADEQGESELGRTARGRAEATVDALAIWWHRAADELEQFAALRSVSELDSFIGRGGAFSLRIAPHDHRIGLFQDLTPEVANRLRSREGFPAVFRAVDEMFNLLQPTWWLVGEERQVHFGENYVDPPSHAYHAFRSLVFLQRLKDPAVQAQRTDRPYCRADLYHLAKLAITLEAARLSH